MFALVAQLWKDEQGALIAAEWITIATILVLGVIVGLVAVESGVNTELEEVANAFMSLNQGFSFAGQSNCKAFRPGSATSDVFCDSIPSRQVLVEPCPIDETPCD